MAINAAFAAFERDPDADWSASPQNLARAVRWKGDQT